MDSFAVLAQSKIKAFMRDYAYDSAIFIAERLVFHIQSDEHMLLLATCYYRSGNINKAAAILQDTCSSNSKLLLAQCYFQQNKLTHARDVLLPLSQTLNPPNAAHFHLLGKIYRRSHQRSKAISCFKQSLKIDPYLWSAYTNLCDLGADVEAFQVFDGFETGLSQKPTKGAVKPSNPLTRALQSPKPSVRNAVKRARTMPATGSMTNIVQRNQLNSQSSSLTTMLRSFGTIYHRLSVYKCQEAIALIQALPDNHLRSPWAQHQLGRAYYELADYKKACTVFQAMHQSAPYRMEGLDIYSTTLWHLKKQVQLSCLARQVMEFDRRSPEAYCTAGNCMSLQKDHDSALLFFHRAIQLEPTFTYAYTLSGHEYVANEDFDKALSCYRHAIRIDPRHYNAWYGLGTIYFRQEKFDLAEYHFKRALEINNSSSMLHYFLGMALHSLKRTSEALCELDIAIRIQPKNLQAKFQYANVLLAQNEYELAFEKLSAIAESAHNESSVFFLMGQIAKKLGRLDDAMRLFMKSLQYRPQDEAAIKNAIQRIHDGAVEKENEAKMYHFDLEIE